MFSFGIGTGIFTLVCLAIFVHCDGQTNKAAAGIAWAAALHLTDGAIGVAPGWVA